jgi:imidazolonepropionase-like amidohydrolase
MKRHQVALLVGLALSATPAAWAQDATILNARIAVGNGPVIDKGYIVVQGGHIVTVGPGQPSQTVGPVIDATGMTAVPGFIDGHNHLNTSPLGEKEQMQDLIDNGFTTVLSALGPAQSNLDLIKKIESGELNGPHIIASSGFINFRQTPDQARAQIRQLAAMGIRFTGEMPVTPEPSATPQELAVLRAVVDEGKKDGVQILVHAVSSPAMVAATEAGVRHQVHLPNKDFMSFDQARTIVDSGTIVLDLISFGDPIIDVFQKDDQPRFRTGLLWPESIAGANRDAQGRATGTEGAYTLINARRLWDASHGTALGYGSDQEYRVHDVLDHELKSLMVMFSMQDVLRVLTINTATFLGMQNDIGTLEPKKHADIVLVQGNPFEDFHDLLKTTVVLKDGKVVVDKRVHRAAPGEVGATAATPSPSDPSSDPPVGTLTASVARPGQAPVMGCQQLSGVHLAQARVSRTQDVAAQSVPLPPSSEDRQNDTGQLPAHCMISAQLRPGHGATYQLQMWLPDSRWNGSLLMLGDGSAGTADAHEGLLRGYAVASADSGRQGQRGKPQARAEAQNRAVHEGIEKAKALVAAYYGGTPRYVYWISGSSNMGQGLAEVQANPSDFDGVVIGAPTGQSADSSSTEASPDLSAFAARGGRIIEYLGGGNPPPSTDEAVHAYQSVLARSGGVDKTKAYYRLFLMPAGRRGDTYRTNWLTVLDEWVQRDQTPDMVLADHFAPPGLKLPPPPGLVFEPRFGVHTVCAYPMVAQLQNGLGETPVDYLCLPGPAATSAQEAPGAERQ